MNDYLLQLFKNTIGEYEMGLIYTLVKNEIINKESIVKTLVDANMSNEEKSTYALKLAIELKDITLKELEDIVVIMGNTKDIFDFAKNVKWANINKLAKATINNGDSGDIIIFAKHIKNAPINELAKAVTDSRDGRAIYYFALGVKNAPIIELEKAMCELKTFNTKFAYYFAKNVSLNDVEGLTDAVIRGKEDKEIILFATKIKGANILKLENAICANGKVKSIYEFALMVSNANKKKLTSAFMKNYFNENELLCNFALLPGVDLNIINRTLIKKYQEHKILIKDIIQYIKVLQNSKKLPINKFIDAVIKCGSEKDIVKFAIEVKEAPVDMLADALFETNGSNKDYWIYKFVKEVKEAPIKKLYGGLKKNKRKAMCEIQYDEKYLKILELVRNKDINGLEEYKSLLNEDMTLTRKIR